MIESIQRYREPRAVTGGPLHHFFGYYEKCPWDSTGRYLLACEQSFIDRAPTSEDKLAVGMVDLADGNRWIPLAQAGAWNWQMGCMLQWLPVEKGAGTGEQQSGKKGISSSPTPDPRSPTPSCPIIHNDRRDGRFVSVIRDASNPAAERVLPMPVYAVSPTGKQAVTLNFDRLGLTRPGYGYPVADGRQIADLSPAPDDQGIYLMDLATGEHRLIVSIAQVAAFEEGSPTADMEPGKIHWFNHLQWNTDGTRFAFLHRYKFPGKGHLTRMFTANPDGSDLFCLHPYKMTSHYDWMDDRRIIAWARLPSSQASGVGGQETRPPPQSPNPDPRPPIPGPVAPPQDLFGYFLFTDRTRQVEWIGRRFFDDDGHCSFYPKPDPRWMLTDTYPRPEPYRSLILYRWPAGPRIDIGRFFSPPEVGGELRCDLHPRWSRDGRQVCIDSVHEGTRQMYVLDVADITGD